MHAFVSRSIVVVLVISGSGACLSPAPSVNGADDGGSDTFDVPGTDTGPPPQDMPPVDDDGVDDAEVDDAEDGGVDDGGGDDGDTDTTSWTLPQRPTDVQVCGLDTLAVPLARWGMDVGSERIPNTGFAGEPELVAGPVERRPDQFEGSTLLFDGSPSVSSHIEHHPMFEELDDGTIALWIRPHTDSVDGTAEVGLLMKDADGTASDGHWALRLRGGEATFRMQRQDGTELVLRSSALTADLWHHVAVTWMNGETRLYLNGALEDEAARGWSLAANPEPVAVGFDTGTSEDGELQPANGYFRGFIDEITIWDSVLAPTQIAAFWGDGMPCPTPSASP